MQRATVYEITHQVLVPMGDYVVMRQFQLCRLDRFQAVADNHGFTCRAVDYHRPVFRFKDSATGESELLAVGPKLASKLREMIEHEVAKEERALRRVAELAREEVEVQLLEANDWQKKPLLARLWHAFKAGR